MQTNYWKNTILSTMYKSGTVFYVGLSSTLPTIDGGGVTEPSGVSYARIAIPSFTEPTNGYIENAEGMRFPTSTEEWFSDSSPAKYYVIFDGNGKDANVLSAETMIPKRSIGYDTTIVVPANTLRIQIND